MKRFLLSVLFVGILSVFYVNAECYVLEGGTTSGSTASANSVMGSAMNFSGPITGAVTYTAKTGRGGGLAIKVQYTTDGNSWTDAKQQSITNKEVNYSCTISTSAIAIRFVNVTKYNTLGITYTNNITNVNVVMAKTMNAPSTLNVGTIAYGDEGFISSTIDVTTTAIVNQNFSANITGANASLFSVVPTTSVDDCEGTSPVSVKFTPGTSPAGTYSCKIELTCGGKTVEFTASAVVTEASITSIDWTQDFSSLLTDDYLHANITLDATVMTEEGPIPGAVVTYSSSDDAVASIIGNVMTINDEGTAVITATYTSADEAIYTSCEMNKTVFVTDGSTCITYLVNDQQKHSFDLGTKYSYSWTKPAAQMSFDISKQAAAIGDAKAYIKDKSGNTLQSLSYSANALNSTKHVVIDPLPDGARSISFELPIGGSLARYVQNMMVTQKTYMTVADASVIASGSNTASATLTVSYSNEPTPIRAYIKDADASTPIQLDNVSLGTACGDYKDNASMPLKFRPKAGVTGNIRYEGTLVISAGANAGLVEIELPLTVTIAVPTITELNGAVTIEGTWLIDEVNTELATLPTGFTSVNLTGANGLVDGALDLSNAGVNCIIFANRNQLSNTQNVVVDGNCANLVLTDGNAFAPVEDFHADAATYSRNMTSTYASLCLPFEAVTDENVQLFTLGEVADGSISLIYADQLAAGTPAMLKKLDEEATSITISGTNVDVVKEPVVLSGTPHLVGTFARTMVGANDASGAAANFYALKNDEFHQGQNYFYSGAFRSYVDATGASLPASLFLLEEEIDFGGDNGMTTDVESAIDTVAKRVEGIYNMQGMRLGQVMPGIICIIRYTDGTCSKVLVK